MSLEPVTTDPDLPPPPPRWRGIAHGVLVGLTLTSAIVCGGGAAMINIPGHPIRPATNGMLLGAAALSLLAFVGLLAGGRRKL